MAIHVGDYRISLDAKEQNANLNFVSHAHSDHTGGVRKKNSILCSEITKDLVETRVSYDLNTVDVPKNVLLLNSGHMFGAKQLYVETDGSTIVYTGDYQMQKSPVAEQIEVRSADILIIDSTYPYPNIVFDDKEEVITSMQHYIRSRMDTGSVLFGAYTMGKAQELVKICNDMGISPIVDANVAKVNEVYSKHGIKLDFKTRDLENGVRDEDFGESVWIVSTNKVERVRSNVSALNRRIFTGIATGFARMQKFNTDVQFALSDHADFKQAVEYIDRCNPKIIYTRGSGCDTFARNLRASGYNAQMLSHNYGMNTLLVDYV